MSSASLTSGSGSPPAAPRVPPAPPAPHRPAARPSPGTEPHRVPVAARGAWRVPGLDGLRAIAVLAVVAFHVSPSTVPGGFVGVDVFFVVSGFLITTLLVREHQRTGRVDLRDFYLRRARRLLPAAAVVLLVGTSLAVLVGGDVLVGVAPAVVGAATFTSNWVQLAAGSDYFRQTQTGLFDNFWSLAVEEQFYLLWPLVLLLVLRLAWKTRLQRVLSLTVVAGAVPFVLMAAEQASAAYLATFARGFGLLLGASLALFLAQPSTSRLHPRSWPVVSVLLGAAGLVALVALATGSWAGAPEMRPLVTTVGSVLAAAVVWGCVGGPVHLVARLDAGLLGWVGRRSYGIYLWYLPAIVLAEAALPRVVGITGTPARLVAVGTAVLAAAVSHRVVEQPIRLHGFRAVLRRPTRGLTAVAVAAGLVAVTVTAGALAPAQTRTEQNLEALASTSTSQQGGGGSGTAEPSSAGTVVAIGDSVMLAAQQGMTETFPDLVLDATVSRQLRDAPDLVTEHVRDDPSAEVVVIGLGINGVGGQDDLRDAIDAAGDREVVLVSVSGDVGWASSVNDDIEEVAAGYDNVAVADWRSQAQAHPEHIARDGIHPDAAGGRLYAKAVADAIDSLG